MTALSVGDVEDHVHVLLSLPATIAISKAMQLIKGNASKWIHETFPELHGFGWQLRRIHSQPIESGIGSQLH